MDITNIVQKLNDMAEYRKQRNAAEAEKKQLIDDLIPTEIREQIAAIEAEYAERFMAADAAIGTLETEIKDGVKALGETVKGDFLMAVWTKGRTSWDDKALSGYSKAHPEILEYRKQGEPSVSIRGV